MLYIMYYVVHIYIYICMYISLSLYIYIYIYIYATKAICQPAAELQATDTPEHAGHPGVHKGGFCKGGFGSVCVITILLLLNPPLLKPPL